MLGDGDEKIHPLVSIDVVGHEVGHGVTEKSSSLLYYNQWGAINEAFSDMMGETSEAYLSRPDWLVGFDITKEGYPPRRYFENPSADNHSISHVDNFTDDLNAHYGSGVYNRVFYLLVHEYQQSIKEIFGVFLHANRMYWHQLSNYHSAACDVMKAAYDLGQNGALFRRAFKEVGIDVCDIQNHIMGLREKQKGANNYPVTTVTVRQITNEEENNYTGDVHIILTNKDRYVDAEDPQILAEGINPVTPEIESNSKAGMWYRLPYDSGCPLSS
ncbi:hypothetical protein C0Q70_14059 [Pomacea canaliculata]|uniref:Peptidase M4 C-terminal domain-containing protein n=1 Tax=Pomacea canaliculata TaxID=400727 RepID=A0A2T7NYY2_POMCA|nr:hypothetical protein C0Q70_14059 [Pomacea canaliculata]